MYFKVHPTTNLEIMPSILVIDVVYIFR